MLSKTFKFGLLFIQIFIFLGCSPKQPVFLTLPKDFDASSYHIMLLAIPNLVKINGYDFYLKSISDSTADYFLKSENNQIWTQRFSVKFAYGLRNDRLFEYQNLLKELYESQKFGKSEFWFGEISDEFMAYQIYYPIKDKLEFYSYDMGINYTKAQKCGIVSYIFNEKFDPHKGIENVKDIAQNFISKGELQSLNFPCKNISKKEAKVD